MRFLKEVSLYPLVSLIFIAAILPFVSGIIPTVNFTSERIDVHVYPDEILVDSSDWGKWGNRSLIQTSRK